MGKEDAIKAAEKTAQKAVAEKIAALNAEYLQNAGRNLIIVEELMRDYNLEPPKPSRAKAKAAPEGLAEAVRKWLAGHTVTAGVFDTWLSREHGVEKMTEQVAIRKNLKASGIIEQMEKADGAKTAYWLKGEQMGTIETKYTE